MDKAVTVNHEVIIKNDNREKNKDFDQELRKVHNIKIRIMPIIKGASGTMLKR